MAHLFVHDMAHGWSTLALERDRYCISLSRPEPRREPRREKVVANDAESSKPATPRAPRVVAARSGPPSKKAALLQNRSRSQPATDTNKAPFPPTEWVILAGTDARLRINGVSVAIGLATLRHRDEVCLVGGTPIFFSTERLASVETYRADDAPRCPRCSLAIELGDNFVCCPSCDVIYHQLPDRECWTYSPTCSLCDQSSDLAAGYRWHPEDL